MVGTTSTQLESVKDLMCFDHLYTKRNCVETPLRSQTPNVIQSSNSVIGSDLVTILKPLSPLSSCHSDSGYESAGSPYGEAPLDEVLADETEMMEWERTFTELFPDLV